MRARRGLISFAVVVAGAAAALVATSASADAATGRKGSLTHVSCASTAFCLAIGIEDFDPYVPARPIVEVRRGGVWSPVDYTGYMTRGWVPTDVSCPSEQFCMVTLAARTTDSELSALIWNGVSWRSVRVPKPADSLTGLSAVSCSSAVSCVAVGGTVTPAARRPYAARWDGSAWTRVTVPAYPTDHTFGVELTDVSCASALCTAVGYRTLNRYGVTAGIVARVAVGADLTWLPAAETAHGRDVFFDGIDCPTATSCLAVGRAAAGAFVVRSDRDTWTREDLVIPYRLNNPSTSCAVDTSSCLVVAAQYPDLDDRHDAFARLLTGSTAADIAPQRLTVSTQFADVSCVTTTACVAVGSKGADSAADYRSVTLAQSWNGSRWIREAV